MELSSIEVKECAVKYSLNNNIYDLNYIITNIITNIITYVFNNYYNYVINKIITFKFLTFKFLERSQEHKSVLDSVVTGISCFKACRFTC
jgi:hypothetical protein